MSDLENNKQLVIQYYKHVAAGDVAASTAMMADNVRFVCADSNGAESETILNSPEAILAMMSQAQGDIFDMSAGFKPEITRLTAEDDRVVAELVIRGKSNLTGLDYKNKYVFIFSIRDGKFYEVVEHVDTAYVNRVLLAIDGDRVGYEPPQG